MGIYAHIRIARKISKTSEMFDMLPLVLNNDTKLLEIVKYVCKQIINIVVVIIEHLKASLVDSTFLLLLMK